MSLIDKELIKGWILTEAIFFHSGTYYQNRGNLKGQNRKWFLMNIIFASSQAVVQYTHTHTHTLLDGCGFIVSSAVWLLSATETKGRKHMLVPTQRTSGYEIIHHVVYGITLYWIWAPWIMICIISPDSCQHTASIIDNQHQPRCCNSIAVTL